MERRGFLKTLVGSVTSAGLLLKTTPSEVEASGLIVLPDRPVILAPQLLEPETIIGQYLYDELGHPVIQVQRFSITAPVDGVITMDLTGYPMNDRPTEWWMRQHHVQTRKRR